MSKREVRYDEIDSMNREELAVKERTRVMMPLLIITAVH